MNRDLGKTTGACWEDRVILLVGIWLAVAPFVLGQQGLDHPGTVTALMCSAILVSGWAHPTAVPDAVQEMIGIAVALGLAASPWLLDYTDTKPLAVNALAAAAVVFLCAIVSIARHRRN